EQRLLTDIVAARVIVQVSQDLIALDEWHRRARPETEIARVEGRVANPDRVAEITGVAKPMTRGDGRGIRGGERREQGVAVFEVHPLRAHTPHGGGVAFVDRAVT